MMIGNERTGGIRLYCRLVHCRMVSRITPIEDVVVGRQRSPHLFSSARKKAVLAA